MSDSKPKVTVKDNYDGRWTAYCEEHKCLWSHEPDEKTYVKQRAAAHRTEHRRLAAGLNPKTGAPLPGVPRG